MKKRKLLKEYIEDNNYTTNSIENKICCYMNNRIPNANIAFEKSIEMGYANKLRLSTIYNIISTIENSIDFSVEKGELKCNIEIERYPEQAIKKYFDDDISYIISILKNKGYSINKSYNQISSPYNKKDTIILTISWKNNK